MSDLFDWNREDPRLIAFKQWHAENPEIYELFKRFANDAVRRGRDRFSARTIVHRIRWYTQVETTGDEYKINDHWSPFYARMFIAENPQHKNFFEFRSAVADNKGSARHDPRDLAE